MPAKTGPRISRSVRSQLTSGGVYENQSPVPSPNLVTELVIMDALLSHRVLQDLDALKKALLSILIFAVSGRSRLGILGSNNP